MTNKTTDRGLLETVAPELTADGFEVYLQPPTGKLPSFLQGIAIHGIALRDDKKMVIEIARESVDSKKRMEKLRRLISKHKGWELRVYSARPLNATRRIEAVPTRVIESNIATIEGLIAEGQQQPALLMAWATFEALARRLAPEKFKRPQTPGRLIEMLAEAGEITPAEADLLRDLATARNGLVHGELQTAVAKRDLKKFVDTLKILLQLTETELTP